MVRPAAEDLIRSCYVAAQKNSRRLENPSAQKYFHIFASLETFWLIVRDIAFDVS
jgi:hypothetical protein